MLPDTCLKEMFIHAQAEEAVIEKEMSADDTLHANGTASAQNIFYMVSFSKLEAKLYSQQNENLLYANAPKIIIYNHYYT
jgi:hypothetical protein